MNLKLKPLFHSYSASCLIVEYHTPITVKMLMSNETYYYLTDNIYDLPETIDEFIGNQNFNYSVNNFETLVKTDKIGGEIVDPTIDEIQKFINFLKLKNPENKYMTVKLLFKI